MLLVIRRVDEVRSGGQRCRMTARTLAVQGDIAGRLVIDIVIGPVTTRMTGRTGVRAAFVTGSRSRSGRWCPNRDRWCSHHGSWHLPDR